MDKSHGSTMLTHFNIFFHAENKRFPAILWLSKLPKKAGFINANFLQNDYLNLLLLISY